MRLAISALVILATASTAWPCPASNDPNWRCSKYDFMYERMNPTPVQIYVRDERGEAPRRTKNMWKHLTATGWHARNDQPQQDHVQLLEAAALENGTYSAIEGTRQVVIGELQKIDHQHQVMIDGAWFSVIRCKEDGKKRTCLQRV